MNLRSGLNIVGMVFLGCMFNAHAQETDDRIDMMNKAPAELRCEIQSTFVSEGAHARRVNITAEEAVTALELAAKATYTNYTDLSPAEFAYRLKYTQAGWNVADTWVKNEIIKLDKLESNPEWKGKIVDVAIPFSVLSEIEFDYMNECMAHENTINTGKHSIQKMNSSSDIVVKFLPVQNQNLKSMENYSGLQARFFYCAGRKDNFQVKCHERKAKERVAKLDQANQAAIKERFGGKTISELTAKEFEEMNRIRTNDSTFDFEKAMMEETAACEIEAWEGGEGVEGVFHCAGVFPPASAWSDQCLNIPLPNEENGFGEDPEANLLQSPESK
jgi:hypothetical protein